MMTAIGITLLLGVGLGISLGVPLGRTIERVRPRASKKDQGGTKPKRN